MPAQIDRLDLRPSVGDGISLLPNRRVGVNNTTPGFALEISSSVEPPVCAVNQPLSNSYGGFFLKNDVGVPGVIFANGSSNNGDGPANNLTIRNDVGGTLRLQNQHFFDKSNNLLQTVGEPAQTASLWGSINSIFPKRMERNIIGDRFFLMGEYQGNVSPDIGDFDGTFTSQLPTPPINAVNPFIIDYLTDGSVSSYWVWALNRYGEIKASAYDPIYHRLFVGGRYASNGITPGIPNLYNQVPSGFTLPSTGAVNYSAFTIAFNCSDGSVQWAWSSNVYANNSFDAVNGLCVSSLTGRVFACGVVSPPVAGLAVNNLNGTPSGSVWTSTGGQVGFALRFRGDLGTLTGLYQWATDNSFFYSLTLNDGGGNNSLMLSGVVYNFVARNLLNWNGTFTSGRSVDAGTTGNIILIRFNNPESNVFNDMQVTGVQFVNQNASITRIQESYVAYNSIRDRYVWTSMYFASIPTFCKESMVSTTNYGQTIMEAKNTTNLAVLVMEIQNNLNGWVHNPVSVLTNYGASSLVRLWNIRFDFSGNAYLCGSMQYSANLSPVWYGPPNGQRSRFQFPFVNEPDPGDVVGLCICITPSLETKGMLIQQAGDCEVADVSFDPLNPTNFYLTMKYRNTSASNVSNFDGIKTPYAIGTTLNTNWNCLNVKYTTGFRTQTFFDSKGVGFGKQNDGLSAQLQVYKGIESSSFVQTREIRSTTYRPPIVVDPLGREIGSYCRCFALLDGISNPFVNMKLGMNVFTVSKVAAGKYRVFFSRGCEYGTNYVIHVSQTGYTGNNLTIFPFIGTDLVNITIPVYKTSFAFEAWCVQTGGVGFDTDQMNLSCFW
jgi:hypothetical protein